MGTKPRSNFQKSKLSNGVRVLTENHPNSRAVSCGIWVAKGSRHELSDEAGLAHFVEHLVFKRTKKRSAFKIAWEMEAVGGDLNAYTSRENTAFVTLSLKEHMPLSLDVLSDLVSSPSFNAQDIEKEKQVVIQEIHMTDDMLEEAIFDRYFELAYPKSPMGRPILGSIGSIENSTRAKVRKFHQRFYTAENIVVSVAGAVDHGQVVGIVEKLLKPPERVKHSRNATLDTPKSHAFREVVKKPSEQAHILIGYPAGNIHDRLRFEAFIVNSALGGGMTSRLYQNVRENRGLVYTIYSQLTTFIDTGQNLIYAGTEPKNVPTVVELCLKDLAKLKKNGLKKKDVEFFKTQVKGSILLGADDIENRMNSIAVNEMVYGQYRSVDDVMRMVEKISLDSVMEFIDTRMNLDHISMLLMGPLPEKPMTKWLKDLSI